MGILMLVRQYRYIESVYYRRTLAWIITDKFCMTFHDIQETYCVGWKQVKFPRDHYRQHVKLFRSRGFV